MKTAISIPDELFDRAEVTARKLGLSRSELYSRAVRTFVEQHGQADVTALLDEIYESEESVLEPSLRRAQGRTLELLERGVKLTLES